MSKSITTVASIETLVALLSSEDSTTRHEARVSLAALGKPAIPLLIKMLQTSISDHARWEAAKTIGSIGDVRAIPALVKALEDRDHDVAWLAAEALRKFKKKAWIPLLQALLKDGPDSTFLRQGAHHVFHNQKEDGMNDLITSLTIALNPGALQEMVTIAATEFLNRLRVKT